jgi:hypothetical protein
MSKETGMLGRRSSSSVKGPIWRTIYIGTSLQKKEYVRTLTSSGCVVTPEAKFKLEEFGPYAETRLRKIELISLTVEDMGFKEAAPSEAVIRWIQIKGQLCWREDASKLRVDYKDQPYDEQLVMPMDACSVDTLAFILANDREKGLILDVDNSRTSGSFWSLDTKIAFRKAQST